MDLNQFNGRSKNIQNCNHLSIFKYINRFIVAYYCRWLLDMSSVLWSIPLTALCATGDWRVAITISPHPGWRVSEWVSEWEDWSNYGKENIQKNGEIKGEYAADIWGGRVSKWTWWMNEAKGKDHNKQASQLSKWWKEGEGGWEGEWEEYGAASCS